MQPFHRATPTALAYLQRVLESGHQTIEAELAAGIRDALCLRSFPPFCKEQKLDR